VKGTDRAKTFGEVALTAYIPFKYPAGLEPGLEEGAVYDPKNFTYPAGCHICEVEIDPDTGVTQVVGFTAVDDVGTVINPMIVEGQVQGGVAQASARRCWRRPLRRRGQLLSGSYLATPCARLRPARLQGGDARHPLHPQPARREGGG